MKTQIFKTTAVIALTSNLLIAGGSCSGGVCGGAALVPQIPSNVKENGSLKPFNFSGKQEEEKAYEGWILVDNGGDTEIGEYRFMSGIDFNSLLKDGDKLSLFGLISSKNETDDNLLNGKFSYAYPLPWENIMLEAAYIQSNYALGEIFPGATGVGTTRSIEGKIIYPFIDSEEEQLKFSLYLSNNNIEEETTNDFFITDSTRRAYSATARIDFESKKYPIFGLDTNHKLNLALNSGNLSFDDPFDEKLDKSTLNTQGSYTKVNIEYKNTTSLSENTSVEANFRGQYALNNKNLDDSMSFVIGGTNGVKVYEERSAYGSNGFFANIEGKYKLPEFGSVKNSIGAFYDYGQIWASDPLVPSDEGHTEVQDAGVGIYTSYKKFFSKVQAAFEVGDSEISTKDDRDYRVLFNAGFVF